MNPEQPLMRLVAHPVTHENARGRIRDRGRCRLLNPYGSQTDCDRDCDPDSDPDIPGFRSIFEAATHALRRLEKNSKDRYQSAKELKDGGVLASDGSLAPAAVQPALEPYPLLEYVVQHVGVRLVRFVHFEGARQFRQFPQDAVLADHIAAFLEDPAVFEV